MPNFVSESELAYYIERYIDELTGVSEATPPPEARSSLWHMSLLPATVIGYVSTNFGVAIEYVPSRETSVSVTRGSDRVEHLLFNAPKFLRKRGSVIGYAADMLELTNVEFSGDTAFPVRLEALKSAARLRGVKCTATGWTRTIEAAEIWGDRRRERWSPEWAAVRARDEVLAAHVELRRAEAKKVSIADYIERFKPKTVLVLGSYQQPGLSRLEALENCIQSLGYEPILLRDIDENNLVSLTHKVLVAGSVARFVVIEDSMKSGHLTEMQLCKSNGFVTVVLQPEGVPSSAMSAGVSIGSDVIHEVRYSEDQLERAVRSACDWAEARLSKLQRQLGGTYPWYPQV